MNKTQWCLLVDDDLDDQEIFVMCLAEVNAHIDCRTANDGAEGIELMEAQPDYVPDYIFLDVNMPRMNGLDCLTELRKLPRLQDTKIFMYSTTSETDVVEESRKRGADDFIIKPVKTIALKEILTGIFNN